MRFVLSFQYGTSLSQNLQKPVAPVVFVERLTPALWIALLIIVLCWQCQIEEIISEPFPSSSLF